MDASPIHVAIAGRMMFKRVMGKASFCNIQDLQGNIQVYVARDAIGTESYADLKNRTSVISSEWKDLLSEQEQVRFLSMQKKVTLLSKSLQILPEKFHGLTDVDTRYRQRYVDLIMNAELKRYLLSSVPRFLSAIRKLLKREKDSWKLRLQCLYRTQVEQQQDRSRHISMP